jgi:ribonuclease VapC
VNVFDASALLAYLQGEAGSDRMREQLELGGVCSAANWSEVAQKVRASGADWELARALLLSFDFAVEPVTMDDAEEAARLWRPGTRLSLGDRLCLALTVRLKATAWTCDAEWAGEPGVQLLR